MSISGKISNFLLELFFPSFCFGCGKEGNYLCLDCQSTLEISEYNYCLCNQKPLRLPLFSLKGKCYRCKDKKISGLYCALPYKEKSLTRRLIHRFKYDPYTRNLKKVLAGIVIEHLVAVKNNEEKMWRDSILIPVPMEKKKLKFRGYNQAEELAKELSDIIKISVISGVLVKTKLTLSQMQLSKEKREENLIGAFAIKNPIAISGKKVFLVDDVYTTGSTMEECARILRKAGAKSVWGIAIAREG